MPSHDLLRALRWNAQQAPVDGLQPQLARQLQGQLRFDHAQRLQALLAEFGDSHLGQPWTEFCRLPGGLGFRRFAEQRYALNGPAEQGAWVHGRGAILVADSYQERLNCARLWVAWRPSGPEEQWPPGIPASTSARTVWQGQLAVTDGLRAIWAALQGSGRLQRRWPPALRPWPFHPGEPLPRDPEQLTALWAERLQSWPLPR